MPGTTREQIDSHFTVITGQQHGTNKHEPPVGETCLSVAVEALLLHTKKVEVIRPKQDRLDKSQDEMLSQEGVKGGQAKICSVGSLSKLLC